MSTSYAWIRSLLATAAMSVIASNVLAQNEVLQEVTVTAQKFEEDLQDVPIAVSVLDRETLEQLKLRSVQEIAAEAPNVQMLGSNGDAQLVLGMRGVSQSDYSPNGTGAIALYVDEVYMGATPLASGVQMFDVERVEMLLGPQGTLYGKNATGGAVNLITVKPQMDGTSGYLDAGVGDRGYLRVGAALDAQVNEQWGTRVALTGVRNDGFVKNHVAGADDQSQLGEWGARWTWLYRTEGFDATMRLEKSRTRAKHSGILLLENSAAGLGFTGYTRAERNRGFQDTDSNRVEDKQFDLWGAHLTMNLDVGRHRLTSITSFDDADYFVPEDADGSPFRLLEDDFSATTRQFAQDFRFTSGFEGPFTIIAGLYYAQDETDGVTRYRWSADFGDGTQPRENFCADDPAFFTGCYYANAYTQTRETIAGYVHATHWLHERLKLTVGLRYTDDHIEVEDYRAFYGQAQNSFSVSEDGPPLTTFQSQFINGIDDSQADSNVSGKLGLDWQANDDVMIYATYSTGYRGSAYNGFAFKTVEFSKVRPEKLRATELGLKSTLGGGRVRLNAAVFHYDYENQQFLEFAGGLQTLRNAGKSRLRGGELQLTSQVTDRLLVNAGLGVLDAEYEVLTLGGVNLAGNVLPSAPETSINASIDYELWAGQTTSMRLRYNGNYVSKQFFEPRNENRLSQGGYSLHNVRLTLALADDSHEFGLFAKNLADKEYAVYSVNLDDWNGRYFFRGLPRTYGLDYKMKF